MRLLAYWRSLAAKFLHRSETDAEMEEELRMHIELRADDLERSGVGRAEAERRARIEFGGVGRFKEEARESLGGHFVETLFHDVRYSARLLRKSPGFSAIAVVTLALAIGANAVVFGVLNALILRPMNLPQTQSLYSIERASDKLAEESYPNYVDLRNRNRSFQDLAVSSLTEVGLDTGSNPVRIWGYEVSGNYFDVLGIQPYLGRLLRASDEHGPDSAPYVVLTYAYWHNHFQDDRGVVGRVVRLNKHPFTIVGVAPPGFQGTLLFFTPDFFVPIVNQEQVDGSSVLKDRGNRSIETFGHLRPGVTVAQAVADLNSIGVYLAKTYPKDNTRITFLLAHPGLFGDFFTPAVEAFLSALLLLSGLILVAACANLGTLFAARTSDRAREVALRLALGSGRGRILRGLFTEAVLISIIGGAAGLWGSILLLRWLSAWQPFLPLPFNVPVTPDATLSAVALSLAIVSALLFGIVPMRQVLRLDPYQIVKAGPSGAPGGRMPLRDVLLAVQITICAVLVTSSLVAVRGMARSLTSKIGIEPRRAMLADVNVNMAGYRGDQVTAMQKRMIDAVSAIPSAAAVGSIDMPPMFTACCADVNVFAGDASDLRPRNAIAVPQVFKVSPGYFRAAGTTLLAGRDFTWHDEKNAPSVAIMNRALARTIFGSETAALGRYFKTKDGTRTQVVGVVEDGRYFIYDLHEPQLAMFLPVVQSPASETWLVVRSDRDPQQMAAEIRTTLRRLDPAMPLFIETWSRAMNGALFVPRIAAVSLGILGIMGAMLSLTGIFGMAAYSVSKRLKELGIRMALGAQRRHVLQAALERALRLLIFGSAAGLTLGSMATGLLAAIVSQATPRDPIVLMGVIAAMILLGLIATWIPAQRALAIDPAKLLREE